MTDKLELVRKYHEENALERLFVGSKELEIKLMHICGMADIAMEIASVYKANFDRELLKLCALHHDDGRVLQYKYLGNFNDRELSHNELGAMALNQWCIKNKITPDSAIHVLRDVMMYHGRLALCECRVTWESRPYIEIISDADDIENGCIGAVGYLLNECRTDAKGYNTTHPEHFGKIKPELWAFYELGQWFDKMKYCESYAEYVLFAATLAMKSIKKYGWIAKKAMLKPSYGYASALQGYEDIFSQVMSYEDAKHAINVLRKACTVEE
ncbi:MAG: HD domain-containing protein [Clostridia bacterium]|nr:HD domain-containing protein [Clostridia bacterium]